MDTKVIVFHCACVCASICIESNHSVFLSTRIYQRESLFISSYVRKRKLHKMMKNKEESPLTDRLCFKWVQGLKCKEVAEKRKVAQINFYKFFVKKPTRILWWPELTYLYYDTKNA